MPNKPQLQTWIPMAQPVPSFLAAKAAAARAASAASKKKMGVATTEIGSLAPTQAPTTRAKPPTTASAKASDAQHPNQPHNAAKVGKAGAKGKRGARKAEEGMQSTQLPALAVSPLGYLREHAARPDAVDLMEQMQPGAVEAAMSAMMVGAGRPGREGVADRTALWKMMGLPWAQPGMTAGAAQAFGNALGHSLGSAVARLEGDRRHTIGTVGHAAAAKPFRDLEIEGAGLVLSEHEDAKAGSQEAQAGQAEEPAAANKDDKAG